MALPRIHHHSVTCPTCKGRGRLILPEPSSLRMRREQAGISVPGMAKRVGVSSRYLMEMEAGRKKATDRIVEEYEGLGDS